MYDIHLKEQERVLSEIRCYGLTLWWKWFVGIIVLSLDFFFMFWLFQHNWWGQTLFTLGIILTFFIFYRSYFFWKRNVCFVTTHRLVDIHQKSFLQKVVSEIPYDQVEDVSGEIKGLWGTLFRYGHVNIEINNGNVIIVLHKIKKPLLIQQLINDIREQYISKYSFDFSGDVAKVIMDKLYELELEDLERIKKVVEKRIMKLGKNN